MPTRRTVLSGVVTFALGGSIVGVGTAASGDTAARNAQSEARDDQTELTVAGDPSIHRITGVPDAVATQFRTVRGRYRSVSLSQVDHLAGTLRTAGAGVRSWAGTAWGSFDVGSIAEELTAETAFSREDRTDEADGGQSSKDDAPEAEDDRESSPQIFVRSEPATVVAVEPDRVDIAGGDTREGATSRLAERRNETDPASVARSSYGGAHVSLGASTREQLIDGLPDSAADLRTVVRGLETAGVGVQAAPETTTVRYAISLREDNKARDALTDLKADLVAHEGTRLLEERTSETAIIADVSIQTDRLWSVHRDSFSTE